MLSVIISLGSPALAAYSLVLTSLNTRSAYRRVKRAELQNRNSVTRALISVQQASLELTADDRLPDNYHWFKEVRGRLHRRNAWSIATASSVAWVVIAYLFTLVDSFVSLNDGTNNPSEGQAVGTIWLWLICLVIGWLWVPTFTHHELKSAIDCANEKATDKTDEKATDKAYESIKRNTSDTYSSVITHGISEMPILTVGHEIPMGQPVTDPVLEIDGENEKANVRSTEEATGPAGLLIYKVKDRLNWDEHRLAATFNYSRFIRHRVLVDSVLRALDKSINKKDEVGLPRNHLGSYLIDSQPACMERIPSWSPHFDVHRLDSRHHSPVRNDRSSCANHDFHPRDRVGVPFRGTRHLRGGSSPDPVPHHHLNHFRSHLRNPQQRPIHHRQRLRVFHCHHPPPDLSCTCIYQRDWVDRVILFPVLQFPRQLLLWRERLGAWNRFLHHN